MAEVTTNMYGPVAQRIIADNIDVNEQHTSQYYTELIDNTLKNYTSYEEQWDITMCLRREILALQKDEERNTITLLNSYASLFALAHTLCSLYPYLFYDKPEPVDDMNGLEAAQISDRVAAAKKLLKQEGVKELDVYEELTDIETYACYGKRRFAQLLLGMVSTFIVNEYISPQQGKAISNIIINGIDAPEQYLEHIVSFSSKN